MRDAGRSLNVPHCNGPINEQGSSQGDRTCGQTVPAGTLQRQVRGGGGRSGGGPVGEGANDGETGRRHKGLDTHRPAPRWTMGRIPPVNKIVY